MNGYLADIEKLTKENTDFRRVLYTAPGSQLVLMCIKPGEDIGEETHTLDQFIRVEAGEGKAYLNGTEHVIADGTAIVVPAGALHNVVNAGAVDLKLYTIYSPPEHKDGTVHKTKADAVADVADHFDGTTTEVT
ncbi:MAG: cupin domain-containing protein [Candidatus Brennerbacteria bacterium]